MPCKGMQTASEATEESVLLRERRTCRLHDCRCHHDAPATQPWRIRAQPAVWQESLAGKAGRNQRPVFRGKRDSVLFHGEESKQVRAMAGPVFGWPRDSAA